MSLGFVFPGQGAQSVGMLGDWIDADPSVEALFREASDAIGEPLWDLVREGPDSRLDETEITQPAVLTASVALWNLWRARGGAVPSVVSGHSLGEYSALVAASSLPFVDAVRLVHLRGRLMQTAVPLGEGAVAAVLGLDDADVVGACEAAPGIVSPANYNAPGQVAIAGHKDAVEAALALCKERGAKRAVLLKLSVPVHCSLMEPAAEAFSEALSDAPFADPTIPVVHNADAGIADDLDGLRARLLAQLAQPVLWTDCVRRMLREGTDCIVECGPGKVLAGLIKRIDRATPVHRIDTPDAMAAALSSVGGADE